MRNRNAAKGWCRDGRKQPHHRLEVFHSAKALVVELYGITRSYPSDELYGLTSQLRRGAVSVVSNISEGSARDTDSDFLRFLYMARGSLHEIDAQLEISEELHLLDGIDCSELRRAFDRTSRQLQGLINKIKRDVQSP